MPERMWPIETCRNCRLAYWACACGDGPITVICRSSEELIAAGPKPERCNNIYHEPGREDLPMNIRLVDYRVCCQSYGHHVGNRCKHCGDKD